MSLESIYYIGQTIAVVAILTSLVAVVYQVVQVRVQAQESNVRARAEFTHLFLSRASDIQLGWFSPDGQNPTMMKALLTSDKLTDKERFEFGVQMAVFFGPFSESVAFNEPGLLDPKAVDLRRQIYGPYLSNTRVRKWWARHGRDFYMTAGTTEVVDQMIKEIDSSAIETANPSV